MHEREWIEYQEGDGRKRWQGERERPRASSASASDRVTQLPRRFWNHLSILFCSVILHIQHLVIAGWESR